MRTLVVVLALALAVPETAAAANPSRTPTPKQLWNAYPLQPTRSGALPSPTATARPAARAERRPATRAAQRHGTSVLLAIALSLLVGAALAWAWLRWRATPRPVAAERREPHSDARPRRLEPSLLRAPARPPPPPPPPPRPQPRQGVALAEAEPQVARDMRWPATADRLWRCELVWQPPELFARLLAPGTQSPGPAESAARATPELIAAFAQLDAELREEGWTPVDPDDRWFSPRGKASFDHRYVWAHPEPPPRTEGAG